MPEARLATGIWVSAYLRRLQLADIPAYIIRHGDDTAGAVLVKCAMLDGKATLWTRQWDFETDQQTWTLLAEGSEPDIDAHARKQIDFDPDLWLIEVESRSGETLLSHEGLT